MVATADIGKLAVGLLQEKWEGHRVAESEGPHARNAKSDCNNVCETSRQAGAHGSCAEKVMGCAF